MNDSPLVRVLDSLTDLGEESQPFFGGALVAHSGRNGLHQRRLRHAPYPSGLLAGFDARPVQGRCKAGARPVADGNAPGLNGHRTGFGASTRSRFISPKSKLNFSIMTQTEKAARFQALHQRAGAFLIPNPWDAGSARILAGLGFEAFATSSGAVAATYGRRDGNLTRDEALASARAIAQATDVPVSADLENGFGDPPSTVAETVRMAAEAGLVGCSIEDSTGDKNRPLYELRLAVERIAAAVETARSMPFQFVLTARAENFVRGKPDLDDTIKRLQAYEKAGADVLFAPALPDLAAVREVCSALSKPVNFMVGIRGKSFSLTELVEAGVRRISFASSLYRAAMTGLIEAASEAKQNGTFNYLEKTLVTAELNRFLPE
jgi:2-methylisocitrate lyase-like PEP mutase family enzyme